MKVNWKFVKLFILRYIYVWVKKRYIYVKVNCWTNNKLVQIIRVKSSHKTPINISFKLEHNLNEK
jgi:hypothetical protein